MLLVQNCGCKDTNFYLISKTNLLFFQQIPLFFHPFPAFGNHPCCQLWVQSARSSRSWSSCIFVIFVLTTQVKVLRSCHKNPVATDKANTEKKPSSCNHHRKLMEIDNGAMHPFRGNGFISCLSPWRGWQPSERRWSLAFGWGVKSSLL